MQNTLRALDFFVSLHLTIFGRPVNFEFFEQPVRFGLEFSSRKAAFPAWECGFSAMQDAGAGLVKKGHASLHGLGRRR
jgi:hypothetical protein